MQNQIENQIKQIKKVFLRVMDLVSSGVDELKRVGNSTRKNASRLNIKKRTAKKSAGKRTKSRGSVSRSA